MRTATFISYLFFFFFAMAAVVFAMPEPVQVGSIVARDADTVPAADGLGALVARGDEDHDKDKDHDYDYDHDKCWKSDGWSKCSKWNYCCKKNETCCGGKKCCGYGYKCYRKDKYDEYEDDDHHKRGDNDYHHEYEWVCKKDDYDNHW